MNEDESKSMGAIYGYNSAYDYLAADAIKKIIDADIQDRIKECVFDLMLIEMLKKKNKNYHPRIRNNDKLLNPSKYHLLTAYYYSLRAVHLKMKGRVTTDYRDMIIGKINNLGFWIAQENYYRAEKELRDISKAMGADDLGILIPD